MLVPLGSGGGGRPEGVSLVGGVVEPGSASLLPDVGGFGGVPSLEVGPGVLGWGESLVGGGSLVTLGSGEGISDVSLGGAAEPSPLLPGPNDSSDGSVLGCVSLEPGPVLGVDVGGWLDVVDGTPLSVVDGCSEVADPSDAVDSGDVLASLGTAESLGCDGGVSELAPLGVVSDGVDDSVGDGVGLVDAVDCVEPGDADGSFTLDGPSVEEVSTLELGKSDAVESLVVDSGSLLAVGDGCELAAGLVDLSESVEC